MFPILSAVTLIPLVGALLLLFVPKKSENLIRGITLLTAIIDPNAQVAQGSTPNVMPQTYQDSISEEQISDIVEFIKSLQ